MHMNHRGAGQGLLWAILFVAIVGIGGFGYFAYNAQQSFAPSSEQPPEEAAKEATASNLGNSASEKIRSYDREANAQTQVAATLYAVETYNGQKRLIADGTTLSASADTSVATVVGAEIDAVVFDSTYYGKLNHFTVSREVDYQALDAYAIATSNMNVQVYTNANVELTDGQANLTLGSGQSDYFGRLKLTVNTANKAFNFKGIAIDLPSASNISTVDIQGMSAATAPKRLTRVSQAEFYFDIPDAKMLHQWESFETGRITFTAVSAVNPNLEAFTFRVVDESYFRSTDRTSILKGVEDDQPSSADVGASDVTEAGNII